MRKITLSVALLLFGGGYIANAQVGIGTPTPASSSMLEVNATNKGVLIPNVKLTSTSVFAPIVGTEAESLMVYNVSKAGDSGVVDVTPGYYYWFASKWNRVINADDLDGVTGYKEGDVIYQDGDVAGELVFKYYTNGAFLEIKFGDMVRDNETNTFIRKVDAVDGDATTVGTPAEYYYFSETDIKTWKATAGNEGKDPVTDMLNTDGTKIDVVGDVVKSFEYLLNQTTIYGGSSTTIKQIIEGLFPGTEDGNVVFRNIEIPAEGGNPATTKWVFQYWDTSASPAVYKTMDLSEIVKEYETLTQIVRKTDGATVDGDLKITYDYFNEAQPDVTDTPNATIDMQADIKQLIEGNTEIKNAITNLLNAGGNVYYTRIDITAAENDGTAIAKDNFYTIDATGKKVLIDIAATVLQVIEDNDVTIKNILGDHIENKIAIKTGDTYNGGAVYIYQGTTTIGAHTAVTSGVLMEDATVTPTATIIGIKVIDSNGITSNVTDVKLDSRTFKFNIGTGVNYTVLPEGTYNVIVEFVGTAVTTTP